MNTRAVTMKITNQLRQKLEETAKQLIASNSTESVVNGNGFVLVTKDSDSHARRVGKTQYLTDFSYDKREFVLFAS